MDKSTAQRTVSETFKAAFDRDRFRNFVNELTNGFDETKKQTMQIPDAFKPHVASCQRIGSYESPEFELADVLIVHLTESYKLERTRTALRDFVAHKLKRGDGEDNAYKEAALVAFVAPDAKSWRFSFVRMEYETKRDPKTGKIKPEERLTPARRIPFLNGGLFEPISGYDWQNTSLAFSNDLFTNSETTKEGGQHHWLELDNNPKEEYLGALYNSNIITPAITHRPIASIDRHGFCVNNKASIAATAEPEMLGAFVNSTVSFWFATQVFATKQNHFYDCEPRYSRQLPIPPPMPQRNQISPRLQSVRRNWRRRVIPWVSLRSSVRSTPSFTACST